MSLSSSTRHSRLSEAAGLLSLLLGLLFWLSLVSYDPGDPSWNTAAATRSRNLIGVAGSYIADLTLQTFGLLSFVLPVFLILVAWKWIRSRPLEVPAVRAFGAALFLFAGCAAFGLGPHWMLFRGTVLSGGLIGLLLADALIAWFNVTGALIVTAACLIVALYLTTSFTLAHAARAMSIPGALVRPFARKWQAWSVARAERRARKLEEKAVKRARRERVKAETTPATQGEPMASSAVDTPPWETPEGSAPLAAPETEPEQMEEIPIRVLEDLPPEPKPAQYVGEPSPEPAPPPPARTPAPTHGPRQTVYTLPSTALLNDPPARGIYDEQELKDIAARIKAKFEEFNVLGSVVQINPGPVVTTFEFKPEAGIKYSRITTLTEDLCLGLQAESILIERIPGKPTVGIEVPNSRREVISLRQILESDEFRNSPSHLTIAMGKDISGRIKVSPLESMPHLLIAGSTGSGKSVMLNSLIMSILYKATPDEVRMILVDPKRLEMGLYEGIPHLLTPVITDAKKATNALRNAVLEMERRLRLLASQGVRNIDQFNKKVRQLRAKPISLFEENTQLDGEDELQPLPYILVLIDELADLMMLEGHNVEQSITRLAQMARAVGMHLVVATQRPSVDVITGLIKANFPARMSFRVATRVDSRTILDVMGAEHLLGKGDMLFLPAGSSRLLRVHGAFVTEAEINRVVEFWKEQATPEYDQSFLVAPPSDEEGEGPSEEASDEEDPMYQDAVRVVLEMGKASTSTLQRRLRLGYGRAARILDMMQRDGIIGPPDGSKPREVLKRPDWLDEVNER